MPDVANTDLPPPVRAARRPMPGHLPRGLAWAAVSWSYETIGGEPGRNAG